MLQALMHRFSASICWRTKLGLDMDLGLVTEVGLDTEIGLDTETRFRHRIRF